MPDKKIPEPHGPACWGADGLICDWPDRHKGEKPPKKAVERCAGTGHNGAGKLTQCSLTAGHFGQHRSTTGGIMLR